MYLVRFRSLGLLATLIHLMLFFNRITAPIYFSNNNKLLTNRIRNIVSLAVSYAAMYFALIDNRATHY
jgi:ABC-type xylose transport system permease subunit